MPKTYFWTGTEVIVEDQCFTADMALPQYDGMPCVDEYAKNTQMRYGYFTAFPKDGEMIGWSHLPFEDFPAAFKVHLLILT